MAAPYIGAWERLAVSGIICCWPAMHWFPASVHPSSVRCLSCGTESLLSTSIDGCTMLTTQCTCLGSCHSSACHVPWTVLLLQTSSIFTEISVMSVLRRICGLQDMIGGGRNMDLLKYLDIDRDIVAVVQQHTLMSFWHMATVGPERYPYALLYEKVPAPCPASRLLKRWVDNRYANQPNAMEECHQLFWLPAHSDTSSLQGQCLTLLNPVPWQNWMAAYLGCTLRMRMLFRGWPIMVKDTHTRRRLQGQ